MTDYWAYSEVLGWVALIVIACWVLSSWIEDV